MKKFSDLGLSFQNESFLLKEKVKISLNKIGKGRSEKKYKKYS